MRNNPQTCQVMTEKQKMLAGLLYDSRDPELLAQYHKARRLMQAYNTLPSQEFETRAALLREMLGEVGDQVWIEAPFYCDYGENIHIGAHTFINTNCMLVDNNTIRIGKYGLIAPYVQIYTALHPVRAAERLVLDAKTNRATYRTQTKPVTIGDHVWIGGNTVILPGVTIGHNVTIGAGSVVTQDIPDDVLAYGNPCRTIRSLR